MIDGSTIYWITRLDYIRTSFIVLSVISALILIVTLVGYCDDANKRAYSDEEKAKKKTCLSYWRLAGSITLALLFLFCGSIVFIPTTKEMCAIKVIPTIANSERIQSLGADVVDLAKSWIVELGPDSVKNVKSGIK